MSVDGGGSAAHLSRRDGCLGGEWIFFGSDGEPRSGHSVVGILVVILAAVVAAGVGGCVLLVSLPPAPPIPPAAMVPPLPDGAVRTCEHTERGTGGIERNDVNASPSVRVVGVRGPGTDAVANAAAIAGAATGAGWDLQRVDLAGGRVMWVSGVAPGGQYFLEISTERSGVVDDCDQGAADRRAFVEVTVGDYPYDD